MLKFSGLALLGAVTGVGCRRADSPDASPQPAAPPQEASAVNQTVSVKVFNRQGELVGPITMPKVVKTDAEWKAQLTAEQYSIARGKGTEPAFCGNLLDNHLQGVYTCICCRLPLFSSDAKFNSGTGWPSFFQPVAAGNVVEHPDHSFGMDRTEILCAAATATWATSLTTAPSPPTCASASIPPRWRSRPAISWRLWPIRRRVKRPFPTPYSGGSTELAEVRTCAAFSWKRCKYPPFFSAVSAL